MTRAPGGRDIRGRDPAERLEYVCPAGVRCASGQATHIDLHVRVLIAERIGVRLYSDSTTRILCKTGLEGLSRRCILRDETRSGYGVLPRTGAVPGTIMVSLRFTVQEFAGNNTKNTPGRGTGEDPRQGPSALQDTEASVCAFPAQQAVLKRVLCRPCSDFMESN